jgi:hypothetical protein
LSDTHDEVLSLPDVQREWNVLYARGADSTHMRPDGDVNLSAGPGFCERNVLQHPRLPSRPLWRHPHGALPGQGLPNAGDGVAANLPVPKNRNW